jgi:single-strand DNA-binding protein
MRETYVAVAGIVATEPQVRTLDDGRQVMSFRVASTSRRFDNPTREWVDGHTLWLKISCWRELADNASRSVRKSDRVLAWGRLHTEQWKGADGATRSDLAMDAEALGHDLAFGVSAFSRKRRAVAQRTLTDTPVFDPVTGEIVSAAPAAGPDAESEPAPDVAAAAGPEPEEEFDELDDDLEDEEDEEDDEDDEDEIEERPVDGVGRGRELLASA